jgi:protoporphyrinogen oxidase
VIKKPSLAIIGAGFTGLSAAYKLYSYFDITFFEAESQAGGLARGFKQPSWDWSLDIAYHHFFASDSIAIKLCQDLNLPLISPAPSTAIFHQSKTYSLNSPLDLLRLPLISPLDRLRQGFILALLKFWPLQFPFNRFTAHSLLPKLMGQSAYQLLWQPLLQAKFHRHFSQISAAWFQARIKSRTPKLLYPQGGYQALVNALVKNLKANQIKFNFNHSVKSPHQFLDQFNFVLSTLPPKLDSLTAQMLILETKKPLLKNTYWLNLTDIKAPFLVAVQHTNFISSDRYNNHHLLYLGNYFPSDHPNLKLNADQTLRSFTPYLKKINSNFFDQKIISKHLFTLPHAQPIVTLDYPAKISPIQTTNPRFFQANQFQIYPQDRGVNYAIKLGFQAAKIIS